MSEFRILVCGGRDFTEERRLRKLLDRAVEGARTAGKDPIIIHGNARGADFLAGVYARDESIEVRVFPADWETYGRSAGTIRNMKMLKEGNPHVVIAFPGGSGTNHMKKIAKQAGVQVYEG